MRLPGQLPHRILTSLVAMMLVIFGLSVSRTAHADPKVEMKQKIKEAMENYDLMDYDAAKKQLTQALALAKKSRLDSDPATARVHIALAIVYFSGIQDQDAAKLSFLSAVQIDPKIQIDAAYKTPEMAKLLEQARGEVGTGGGSSGNTGGGSVDVAVDTGPAIDCSTVKGFQHTILENGTQGTAQPVEVDLGNDVSASKVSIMYRSEGQTAFTEVKMNKSGCKYTGSIPAAGMKGELVHYYVAAYDGGGKVVASKGSAGSPNIMELAVGKGGHGAAAVKPGDDEDPITGGHKAAPTQTAESGGDDVKSGGDVSAGVTVDSKSSKFTIAVSAGTGLGYVTGSTEGGNTVKNCCVGTNPFILVPELAYYISPATSIGVAVRLGFPLGADVPGHATLAPGGMIRVRHFLGGTSEGVRVMGEIGGGIMRNTIKLDNATAGMDTDIVAQGPMLLGGGIGYTKILGGSVAFVADLGAVAGIPIVSKLGTSTLNFGLTADLSLGLQVGF